MKLDEGGLDQTPSPTADINQVNKAVTQNAPQNQPQKGYDTHLQSARRREKRWMIQDTRERQTEHAGPSHIAARPPSTSAAAPFREIEPYQTPSSPPVPSKGYETHLRSGQAPGEYGAKRSTTRDANERLPNRAAPYHSAARPASRSAATSFREIGPYQTPSSHPVTTQTHETHFKSAQHRGNQLTLPTSSSHLRGRTVSSGTVSHSPQTPAAAPSREVDAYQRPSPPPAGIQVDVNDKESA